MSAWAPSAGLAPRMIALALGCVLLASMAKALRRGSTQLIGRSISRNEDPVLYWTGIIVCVLGGMVLVLAAIFPRLERL